MTAKATLMFDNRLYRRGNLLVFRNSPANPDVFNLWNDRELSCLQMPQAMQSAACGGFLEAQGLCKWIISGGMIAFAPEIIQAQSA
jgi:hypothetical protein